MPNVLVNDDSLKAIGNAIREKNGETTKYKPAEMAAAITAISGGSSGYIPTDADLTFYGNINNLFVNNRWNWLLNNYGDKITTQYLDGLSGTFSGSSKLEEIKFSLNLRTTQACSLLQAFLGCNNLKKLPIITGTIGDTNAMCSSCYNLQEIPNEWNAIDFTKLHTQTAYLYSRIGATFRDCYSLRKIPSDFLKQLYNKVNNHKYAYTGEMFSACYCLDEIIGLRMCANINTNNMFVHNFLSTSRLKKLLFDTENGAPRIERWKNQVIDLTTSGYLTNSSNEFKKYILQYNSGITADKEITDDTSYSLLKNDNDCFTCNVAYSRYNKLSAIETINSLPDTSAYLATAGGTNTIKFKGAAGSATDGGAINTMTEEEIAVATAKGWTVSFV